MQANIQLQHGEEPQRPEGEEALAASKGMNVVANESDPRETWGAYMHRPGELQATAIKNPSPRCKK